MDDFDDNLEDDLDFEKIEPAQSPWNTPNIRQSSGVKKIPDDPWQFVPHKKLSARKVVPGAKIKPKTIQGKKITSVKKFSKIKPDIKIKNTPLASRKAQKIDLSNRTIPEVIKVTLKDYNSIDFKAQAS
jgi:hypothetical protein